MFKAIFLGTVEQINTGNFGLPLIIYLIRGLFGGLILSQATIYMIADKLRDEAWHHWAFWLVNVLFGMAWFHVIWFIGAIVLVAKMFGFWNGLKEVGFGIIAVAIFLVIMLLNGITNAIKKI